MGVTIHYHLAQKKEDVKSTLDSLAKKAVEIQKGPASVIEVPVKVSRIDVNHLVIDIGGCEPLSFRFMPPYKLPNYIYDVGISNPSTYPFNPLLLDGLLCVYGFCKTQYAEKLAEHRFVADLISHIAGKCVLANVYDEGRYYHSGDINEAQEAIGENGKMIDSLSQNLEAGFGKDDVIKGGKTRIKPRKIKK